MSENRFDRMRRRARNIASVAANTTVESSDPNFDALRLSVSAAAILSDIVIELADEAEKAAFQAERAAFGKYAEGRSITA